MWERLRVITVPKMLANVIPDSCMYFVGKIVYDLSSKVKKNKTTEEGHLEFNVQKQQKQPHSHLHCKYSLATMLFNVYSARVGC